MYTTCIIFTLSQIGVYVYIYMYVIYLYIYIYQCICIYIYILNCQTCMSSIYIYIHSYIYIYMYVYIYIYIYIEALRANPPRRFLFQKLPLCLGVWGSDTPTRDRARMTCEFACAIYSMGASSWILWGSCSVRGILGGVGGLPGRSRNSPGGPWKTVFSFCLEVSLLAV